VAVSGESGNNVRGWRTPSPIVIGGVGGSGTRLAAEIVRHSGVHIGADRILNRQLDNLLFTFLFKRPAWFFGQTGGGEIRSALRVFAGAMTARAMDSPQDLCFAASAAEEYARFEPGYGDWLVHVKNLLRASEADLSGRLGWGWKEPNSHIYLDHLCHHFPRLRYIHLIRHGLDMVYSRNQQQARNWGRLVGLSEPQDQEAYPAYTLEYWLRANRRAIGIGADRLGPQFLLVRFEELVDRPQAGIERILRFLEIDMHPTLLQELVGLVHRPESIGRYKQHDLAAFSTRQLEEVEQLGYPRDV